MTRVPNRPKKNSARAKKSRFDVAYLEELIETAIVDCYGEYEQFAGLYLMLQEHLEMPFITEVLGMEVEVTQIELNDAQQIVAVCKQGKHSQRVPILDLPMPKELPKGAEWIDAYRRWARGW